MRRSAWFVRRESAMKPNMLRRPGNWPRLRRRKGSVNWKSRRNLLAREWTTAADHGRTLDVSDLMFDDDDDDDNNDDDDDDDV